MIENIVFIPGLGEGFLTNLQNKYVRTWKNKNRRIYVFEPRWSSEEDYENKYSRLTDLIQKIDKNEKLTIVAASAGGSLATRLLSEIDRISHAHIISGKNSGADIIGQPYKNRAPALVQSVKASEKTLLRAVDYENKVTVYKPLTDGVVPLRDMLVGDSTVKRVPAVGHVAGIATALLFYLP